MAAWAGFSEEELRRIQHRGDACESPRYSLREDQIHIKAADMIQSDDAIPALLGRGRRSAPTNRSRQQLQREQALQRAAEQKCGEESPLSPDQQLKPPMPQRAAEQKRSVRAPVSPDQQLNTPPLPAHSHANQGPATAQEPKPMESLEEKSSKPDPDPPVMLKELDTQAVELREQTRLQQLQWEQRLMEEKNKRRKALIAKTIAEKSKQTQAETVKLKKVQKELQVLDDSVSSDISILRKLIEQASMDYCTAQKRLEKAEVEYVAAKLDLHKKTEVKEQLTEHLCAIIQQNELRKARKLEELMLQLELNAEETGPLESPTLQTAEQGEGAKESPAQTAALNGPTGESNGETQTDSGDLSKNSATAILKTSKQQEVFIAATENTS